MLLLLAAGSLDPCTWQADSLNNSHGHFNGVCFEHWRRQQALGQLNVQHRLLLPVAAGSLQPCPANERFGSQQCSQSTQDSKFMSCS